uniref:Uncharacterized protein n=1 Tax=Arundo donax TaxID=35708 RepID=A0A0A9GV65_ARUDO
MASLLSCLASLVDYWSCWSQSQGSEEGPASIDISRRRGARVGEEMVGG